MELHRAIASLIEEFEAVDWYQQRVDVSNDDELKSILTHNLDEEIEHAVMTLEWLRRRLPFLDEQLRKLLFTEGPIRATHAEDAHSGHPNPPSRDLGIGNIGS